jgi:hypothetical protein
MKKIWLLLFLLSGLIQAEAQTQAALTISLPPSIKQPPLDKSPLDIAYFPADYPLLKTQNKAPQSPLVRVIYSRPQRDNRVVFGELVEYGKVWRLGANEATEIEFFKDATIAGKKVPKGRYTIYAIPTTTKWTIILNRDTDTWGAFVYDEKKDLLRTDVPIQTLATPVDAFSIYFTRADKGAQLVIAWENAGASIPIEIK